MSTKKDLAELEENRQRFILTSRRQAALERYERFFAYVKDLKPGDRVKLHTITRSFGIDCSTFPYLKMRKNIDYVVRAKWQGATITQNNLPKIIQPIFVKKFLEYKERMKAVSNIPKIFTPPALPQPQPDKQQSIDFEGMAVRESPPPTVGLPVQMKSGLLYVTTFQMNGSVEVHATKQPDVWHERMRKMSPATKTFCINLDQIKDGELEVTPIGNL